MISLFVQDNGLFDNVNTMFYALLFPFQLYLSHIIYAVTGKIYRLNCSA